MEVEQVFPHYENLLTNVAQSVEKQSEKKHHEEQKALNTQTKKNTILNRSTGSAWSCSSLPKQGKGGSSLSKPK